MNQETMIGIDVSKQTLAVWDNTRQHFHEIKNEGRAIGNWLKKQLNTHTALRVVLEPTGGYEKKLVQALLNQHIATIMVHPTQVYHFSKGKGVDAKTDKLDAKMLAAFGLSHPTQGCLATDYVDNEKRQELSKRRRQLKEMIHTETCRQQCVYFNKAIARSNKRLLNALNKELKQIDALIDKALDENTEKREQLNLLKTFKGVGKETATILTLRVPELGTLSKVQIARLIGVAPINKESGKANGYRRVQGGRQDVRNVLYMAALVAIRHNEAMKHMYQRLRKKGKAAKVAIVAVMRRMIGILNAMVRDNQPWQKAKSLATQNA